MSASYETPEFDVDAPSRTVTARFRLVNSTNSNWSNDDFRLGWQMFDPDTGTFIAEGEWLTLGKDLAPAESSAVSVPVTLPKERGRYHVYLSPLDEGGGWFYSKGKPFVLIDAAVEDAQAHLLEARVTTLRGMRWRKLGQSFRKFFTLPFETLWTNAGLIRSMVRRDITARYRGSMGDFLWAVLNPLMLMATYFFVFGVVLQSRFGGDSSRTGFALYFLAGMLPWLAFSEAIGRAPHVIPEHRNFVKKLVFPVEILPVTQVISGVVTQLLATVIFLAALWVIRGAIPATALAFPVLLIPQILFTMGFAWMISAFGVFLRDLGQIMGFVLTLWFFVTPICYPEASLPAGAAEVLLKNPIYLFVDGYRGLFLESELPSGSTLAKAYGLGACLFLLGHACFYKLRKSFADVI